MAKGETVSFSLTPEQVEFLSSMVSSGRCQSTSEAVRDAVRLLEDRYARRQAEIDRARTLIREGAEQLTAGPVVDGDLFFKEWDAELDLHRPAPMQADLSSES